MRQSLPILDEMTIPVPCAVPWESMRGDDRSRHRPTCNQTVHNLSTMSRADAADLVANQGDRVCVRFSRSSDGTVITSDYQHESPLRDIGWISRAAVALLSWLGLTMMTGCNPGTHVKKYQGSPMPPRASILTNDPQDDPESECEEKGEVRPSA